MENEDPLLKPKEAADHARVSVDLLAQLRFKGTGPAFLKPTPRTVLYRRSALDAWLNASERTTTGRVA